MKRFIGSWLVVVLAAGSLWAAPLRVAVLEFQDQTGQASDARLGGAIAGGAMAEKGVFLLGKQLANQPEFTLVDRRDLFSQMERLQPKDGGAATPTKPSFLHAAQLLRADAVLRGSLLSLSTGKESINLGGHATERSTLTVRVGLEALDAVDGAVIAAVDGRASRTYRQTESFQTSLGEDEVTDLVEEAMGQALPALKKTLAARQEQVEARPRVKMSVKTSADPALVEVDGVLVGTTPLEGFELYQGDHVVTIGKPGYRDITKRILFEKDVALEAPLLRTELTADELKDVLEKMRMNVIVGEPGLIIHTIDNALP